MRLSFIFEIADQHGQMDSTYTHHARWVVWSPAWPQLTPMIHYTQATSSTGDGASTLALKPMGRVNRSPKQSTCGSAKIKNNYFQNKFCVSASVRNGKNWRNKNVRKINCELTKNLKDNHDMWVIVLQKEAAAAAALQKEEEQLNGAPEPPVSRSSGVRNHSRT